MKELLIIKVIIKNILEVEGTGCTARMISFGGECHSDIFTGSILEGGIDAQQIDRDGNGMVSARYMIEGTDCSGKKCRLYIENNGEVIHGKIQKTYPKIITDSEKLKWLERASLYGVVTAQEEAVLIRFYEK